MKKLYNKIFLLLTVIMLFLTPTTVFAGNKTELWEINVTMNTTKPPGSTMYSINNETLTSAGIESGNKTAAWNKVFTEYKGAVVGISGIATLTFVALFIFNFMKLGATSGNPQARQACVITLLWTGIAAACCGGFTIFLGFFHGLLKV